MLYEVITDNDPFGVVAIGNQPSVYLETVIGCSGKGMFRSQPVVRNKSGGAGGLRQLGNEKGVGLGKSQTEGARNNFV